MKQILLPPNTFVALALSMLLLPGPVLLHGPARWAGSLLVVAGFALLGWANRVYTRHDCEINTFKTPRSFVSSGPFRFSRNPMYLGFCIALLGCAWAAATPWALAPWGAFVALCAGWYIPVEEANAAQAFGEPYRQYQAAVPRWVRLR